MTDVKKLKQELDNQVQKITEEHGQKFAEETAERYLEKMEFDDVDKMQSVIKELLACPQEDFYRLWFPIVDLCLIKNFKVYNHIDRSLGYVDGVVRRAQEGK